MPRLPTAVLSTGLMIIAALAIACGLVLDTVTRGRREMKLPRLSRPTSRARRDLSPRRNDWVEPALAASEMGAASGRIERQRRGTGEGNHPDQRRGAGVRGRGPARRAPAFRTSSLDQNMSVLEGSLGILPRRVLVAEDQVAAARRLLEDAGLGHELRPDAG